MEKQLYCKFDMGYKEESSVGALRIYIPTKKGYINFNISHAVKEEVVADNWRLSYAYACDDELQNEYPLNPSAEWDMALLIKGRDDFLGGVLHGDEISTDIHLFIDGAETEITSIYELKAFNKLNVMVDSVGYDPADHKTKVLIHKKEYIITKDGVALEQQVKWLDDYTLDTCYMAMMPPLKEYTDSYCTDVDPAPRDITTSNFEVANCKSATLFGKESGLLFRMSVPKYPCLETGGHFILCDNGGRPYNKMYFPLCHRKGEAKCGDKWETRTEYTITNGETNI